MSFNKKPAKKKSKNEEIEKFINEPVSGSNEYKNNTNTNTSIEYGLDTDVLKNKPEYPWESLNKKSKQRSVFNIRFNEYYESAYKYFSQQQGFESYQLFIRGIIEKKLDDLIEHEQNRNEKK